jgi:Uma2 family endonuclease
MANTAIKLMSVEEFLVWEDGTDSRHQLIDGRPVAMAPSARRHAAVSARLARAIGNALARRPGGEVYAEVGIRSTVRPRNFFIADFAVSCTDAPDGSQELERPVLIVEVLSPSTEAIDRKLHDYRQLPTVQEIVLIDAAEMFCEVHRRVGDMWRTDLLRDPNARVVLESVDLDIPLGELYAGIPLEESGAG